MSTAVMALPIAPASPLFKARLAGVCQLLDGQNIRRFTIELHGSLEKLKTNALAHRGNRTDILGSLDIAQQEIVSAKSGAEIILITLSDFIQEDRQTNFKTDRALANVATAQALAKRIAQGHRCSFTNAKVYLGRIRSAELAGLDQERRKATQAFCIQYFTSLGVTPHIVTDGPGLLEPFIQREAP